MGHFAFHPKTTSASTSLSPLNIFILKTCSCLKLSSIEHELTSERTIINVLIVFVVVDVKVVQRRTTTKEIAIITIIPTIIIIPDSDNMTHLQINEPIKITRGEA